MINSPLSLDKAIETLNRFVRADPEAMRLLIETRVPCNETLANDPTCQVSGWDGTVKVGLLGILNGLYGTYDEEPLQGWGAVAAVFSDDEKILYGFRRTRIPGVKFVSVESDLPGDVAVQIKAFLQVNPEISYSFCENELGWQGFPLGQEYLVEPSLVIPKDFKTVFLDTPPNTP